MGCCAVIFWGLIALFALTWLATAFGWPFAVLVALAGLVWAIVSIRNQM